MSYPMMLSVETITSSIFKTINVEGIDLLWIHVEGDIEMDNIVAILAAGNLDRNIRCVMTSGTNCEALHDSIDQILEDAGKTDVLTTWCEESFSEAIWEFWNLYGLEADVGKILILADSTPLQMRLLADLSSSTLEL